MILGWFLIGGKSDQRIIFGVTHDPLPFKWEGYSADDIAAYYANDPKYYGTAGFDLSGFLAVLPHRQKPSTCAINKFLLKST